MPRVRTAAHEFLRDAVQSITCGHWIFIECVGVLIHKGLYEDSQQVLLVHLLAGCLSSESHDHTGPVVSDN